MGNRISDLNDILFKQLERLNDPELKGKDLTCEISRSQAISMLAREVTANGDLVLKGYMAVASGKLPKEKLPKMLEGGE